MSELFYRLGESIYGAYAAPVAAQGWSIFPQDRDAQRRPSKVRGDMVRWGAFKNTKPTIAEIATHGAFAACSNVAVVFGPASGHTFAVDIDVTDPLRADAIWALAEKHLGETPFQREGMSPKIALIYRHSGADGEAVPSRSVRLRDFPEDGVEILGAGKSLTLLGIHWKTGRYFIYQGAARPFTHGPSHAPMVSRDAVDAFLAAVEAEFGFLTSKAITAGAGDWSPADAAGVVVPKLQDGAWVRDAEGLVIDGRWQLLGAIVARTVYRNADKSNAADAALRGRLCAAVETAFTHQALLSGRWAGGNLKAAIAADVARCCERIASN